MFIVIVPLIVFIAFCIYAIVEGDGELVMAGVIGAGTSMLICFALSLVILVSASACDAESICINEERTELYALQDNMGMKSHYYLFSGVTEEDLHYYYLHNVEGKGIAADKLNTNNTYLNYTAKDEHPYFLTKTYKFKSKVLNFFTLGMGEYKEHIVYIPEGSITVDGQYKVNLN